ncbi:ABC transporter G family member [Arachis hypogaea]|nr:ABC transporter G family member [Arachis hypogaea]
MDSTWMRNCSGLSFSAKAAGFGYLPTSNLGGSSRMSYKCLQGAHFVQLLGCLPRRSLSVANPPSTLSLANPQSSLLPPWFGTRRVAVSLSEVVAPPSPPPSLVAPPSATFSVRSTVVGVLTGLVGVSRAGKTTLMDVLAGRKTGGVVKCSCSAGRAGKPTVRWTKIQIWFEDRLEDLPDDPNNELMIPEDPECNKEGELS